MRLTFEENMLSFQYTKEVLVMERRLLTIIVIVVFAFIAVTIIGPEIVKNPAAQPKAATTATPKNYSPSPKNYSIEPLEQDPGVLIVDPQRHSNISNVQAALNDISLNYGPIKDVCSFSENYVSAKYTTINPTTHLIVKIDPFPDHRPNQKAIP